MAKKSRYEAYARCIAAKRNEKTTRTACTKASVLARLKEKKEKQEAIGKECGSFNASGL